MNLTDSGTLIRLAYQGFKALEVDADLILNKAGFDKSKLYETNLRTPFSAQPIFWKYAVEISGDPAIGLHLGEKMPIYKGQILEYLILSSASFGDGLERVLKYQRLISDALHASFIKSPKPHLVSYFTDFSNATSHLAEAMVVGLVRSLNSVTDDKFNVTKIVFNHKPNTCEQEYERIFGCPIEFDAKSFKLYFDESVLNHKSIFAEPTLLKLHLETADKTIELLNKNNFVRQIRSSMASLLETNSVTLESVAANNGMTARQLRHKLRLEETNFQNVLDDLKHELATKLLTNTSESISEIVYLTGFSEPSTFYRAFQRWEKMTPLQYRNLNRSNAV